MDGCKVNWPSGVCPVHPFDQGTLCLGDSPRAGPLGLPRLTVDTALLNSARTQHLSLTIGEALRRGATRADLGRLEAGYLWLVATGSTFSGGPLQMQDISLERSLAEFLIDVEVSRFDTVIQSEMARLSAVGIVGAKEPIKDSDEYQHQIRPLYYSFGYTDPVEFLEQQTRFALLGKASESTWVHRDLAQVLQALPRVLEGWGPGLAAETAREVTSVNGLQIRKVAGKESLSNHAFGCAIDVNALSNPHVVGPAVVEVFNWVAKKGGVNFDFGGAALSKIERGGGDASVDDIMEIHNRAVPASEAVRRWISQYLPQYRQLIAQLEMVEKTLRLPKPPSTITLKDRYARDAAAAKKLSAQSKVPAGKTPAPGTKPGVGVPIRGEVGGYTDAQGATGIASTSGSRLTSANAAGSATKADEANVALQEIDLIMNQISSDPDLSRLQILHEHFDTSYINTWAKHGVMTMPLYLAAALVGVLKLKWGEQYEGSKDGMHFELLLRGKAHVQPKDADKLGPHEPPRTLELLLKSSFRSPIELASPQRKQSRHVR